MYITASIYLTARPLLAGDVRRRNISIDGMDEQDLVQAIFAYQERPDQ